MTYWKNNISGVIYVFGTKGPENKDLWSPASAGDYDNQLQAAFAAWLMARE